jgi:hypothetical protein
MTDDLRRLSEKKPTGPIREIWGFLAHTKKWWLAPILIMLAVLGALILLGGTGAAPFIYTLF